MPAVPTGFCVAMTVNGSGTGCVTPSMVTCRSSITSSSADCVLLDVRLISSASSRLHITAPGLYWSAPLALSYTEKPMMSEGTISEVN